MKSTPQPTRRRGLAGFATAKSLFTKVPKLPSVVALASSEDQAKATSQSTKMAATMARTGLRVYVRPTLTVRRERRAAGKRQRQARAAHRRAARR